MNLVCNVIKFKSLENSKLGLAVCRGLRNHEHVCRIAEVNDGRFLV